MPKWVRIGASVAVVAVIFMFALPKMADFSNVWAQMRDMTQTELFTLAALALWNIVTYWFVMMAALPGTNVWQTMKVNQASTAVANTVPGGGAVGVAVTYGMLRSYGFTGGQITLSVLVTGIWNNFLKLGMPVIALGLLVLEQDVSSQLTVAAGIGVAVLIGALALFGAVLAKESAAAAVGSGLERSWNAVSRRLGRAPRDTIKSGTIRFRRDAIELIRKRGLALTLATLVSHISLYLVLLIALRHVGVGSSVTWIEVLAVFALVRLLSALPITPGGLGVVELGLTAGLIAAGGPRAETVAAVLVYRALTYLLPIPFGVLAYLKWRAGSAARSERAAVAATSSGTIPHHP